MNRTATLSMALVVVLAMWAAAPAHADEAQSELKLEPCTIELVDGTKIEGHLAVQFEMDDHLIVYSPRLATVRSFLKEHVHALTVDGRREQLHPKRALTGDDRKLLGRVRWPNAQPAEGPRPAYTTEQWDKPRQLLVWADPGSSGRFEEPGNWLRNGRPMIEWPRAVGEHYGLVFFDGRTDLLFPASARRYVVRPRASNARPRHITAEANVDAEVSLNNCTGNLWISPNAKFDGGGGAQLGGDRHTFFLNGTPYTGDPPTTAERFGELMGSVAMFGRKWVVRKDDPQASMTLIGTFGSGDETHWHRGVTILEENSVIAIGPRCEQVLGPDGTMIMKSGAVLGKRSGNQCYKNDMLIKGTLLVGTPDVPITRDVYLGMSIKDSEARAATGKLAKRHAGPQNGRGLTVAPHGSIVVHSARPGEAQLHITWHGTRGSDGGDDGTPVDFFERLPDSERTINVNLIGDHVLQDVAFDWVGEGDIRLLNPSVPDRWQRVRFGEQIRAEPDAIFTKLEPGEETRAQLARWRKEAEQGVRMDDNWGVAVGKGARYPRILPSGGTFADGQEVQVRLDALSNPEIRYTLDGNKAEDGKIYAGPFELTETTTVKAGCHEYPPPHFRKRWTAVSDTFNFIDDARKPDQPGKTLPGLLVRIYEDNSFDKLHEPAGNPEVTQTPDRFVLDVPDGRMKNRDGYLYTGYLEIDTPGVYRFYTETEGPSRLYIGDHLIVDNHRRYRYDWNPAGRAPLESWGSLKLEPGMHAIRVEYGRGAGFSGWPPWEPQDNEPFTISYEGPNIEKQPIPAKRLSRQPRWSTIIDPAGGLHDEGEKVDVRIGIEGRADARDVNVRYTLDGSDPTADSPVYGKPITVTKPTTIKARCFKDGKPMPGRLGEARFVFLADLGDAEPGLIYRLYHGSWDNLPDFDQLKPARTGVSATFDIEPRDRDDNFGFVFTGYLHVPSAGEYTFYTESDDGSALYIDGKHVVFNDGLHGLQESNGKITLGQGAHVIRVEFFEAGGGQQLSVRWRGPGFDKQAILAKRLSHNPLPSKPSPDSADDAAATDGPSTASHPDTHRH
jgi:hypothetical protein